MNHEIKILLLKAKQYEEQRDWQKAFRIYRELYKKTHNQKLFFKLGYVCSNLKNHQISARFYEKYLKLYPQDMNAYHNLGIEYYYLKQYKKAERILLHALKMKPSFLRTSLLLGYLYELWGNYSRSLRYFLHVYKHDPLNRFAIIGTIHALMYLKQYQKALEICERGLKVLSDDFTLKNLRATISLYLKDSDTFYQELKELTNKDQRYKSFEEYLQKIPEDKEHSQFLKEVHKKFLKQSKEIKENSDPKSYVDLSIFSLFSGNKDQALEYLRKAIEQKEAF